MSGAKVAFSFTLVYCYRTPHSVTCLQARYHYRAKGNLLDFTDLLPAPALPLLSFSANAQPQQKARRARQRSMNTSRVSTLGKLQRCHVCSVLARLVVQRAARAVRARHVAACCVFTCFFKSRTPDANKSRKHFCTSNTRMDDISRKCDVPGTLSNYL